MTERTITEIEVALAEHYQWKTNIIVFNVTALSGLIFHECDMLVLSKTGFLTEIEIKRTWSDFLADFKKDHSHESELIKEFNYCVPISIKDKVKEYLLSNKIICNFLIFYDEHLTLFFERIPQKKWRIYRKLFLEEQLKIARLGAMRVIPMKKKIINID